jgi:hypothetical protein
MIASPGPLDELSLVHRCLTLSGTIMVERASQGMAFGFPNLFSAERRMQCDAWIGITIRWRTVEGGTRERRG